MLCKFFLLGLVVSTSVDMTNKDKVPRLRFRDDSRAVNSPSTSLHYAQNDITHAQNDIIYAQNDIMECWNDYFY